MTENFNIHKTLSTLKDNLNLIIIIPAILGGLWQIIELSNLSLSFIRFFSVTQLVADGILIILIFIFLIGSVLLLPIFDYWIIPPNPAKNEIVTELNENSPQSYMDKCPIYGSILFHSLIFLLVYGFVHYKVDGLQELLIYTVIGLIVIYLLRRLYLNERKNSINYKRIIYLSTFSLFISMFMYVGFFCKHIHKLFHLPANFKNIEQLINEVKLENPTQSVEILYTNDKFIFIGLINKKTKIEKIEIIPFENLTKR